MRVVSEKTMPSGKRRLVVELDQKERLVPVLPNRHYKLGYPVLGVVPSHVVEQLQEVSWCSVSQEWAP